MPLSVSSSVVAPSSSRVVAPSSSSVVASSDATPAGVPPTVRNFTCPEASSASIPVISLRADRSRERLTAQVVDLIWAISRSAVRPVISSRTPLMSSTKNVTTAQSASTAASPKPTAEIIPKSVAVDIPPVISPHSPHQQRNQILPVSLPQGSQVSGPSARRRSGRWCPHFWQAPPHARPRRPSLP